MRRWLPILLLLAIAGAVLFELFRGTQRPAPIVAEHAAAPLEPRAELAPATAPAEANAPKPSSPAAAHLKVRVIGKSKRTPIAGADVGLWLEDTALERMTVAEVKALKSPFRRPLNTNADGRVEFEPPVDLDMEVSAISPDRTAGQALADVPRLSAGELREIILELPDANDAHVFGRIVAAGSRIAVAGALVKLICVQSEIDDEETRWTSTPLGARTTTPDGSFEFDYPAWRNPHLRVEASGFGLQLSEPLKECTNADRPLVIELQAHSALHARVIDPAGKPLDSVLVNLVADGTSLIPDEQKDRGDGRAELPDERWKAESGPDGWISFEGLPSRTWIEVYLNAGGKLVRPAGDGVELAPGETRKVEWRIGGACTLHGQAIDGDGKPVEQLKLWLARAGAGNAPYFIARSGRSIEQTTTTDYQGRFEMVGVPAGAWFLGPAPEDWRFEPATESSFAPVPERVVIGDELSKEFTLHVNRALFIRGRALDPDGKPLRSGQIIVDDEDHHSLLIGSSDEKGEFILGPLGKQTVILSANGQGRYMSSPPLRARAGDSGIELRLRTGGKIRGRVVDAASGGGCPASLQFTLEGPGEHPFAEWTNEGSQDDGNFESAPCEAGSYSIGAMTDDGRFALVKGIGVTIGAEHRDVLLQVRPGGRLRFKYDGKRETVWGRILLDGVVLAQTGPIGKGRVRLLPMPAGVSLLQVHANDDSLVQTKQIELKPGETKEVVLTDED